MKRTDTPTFLQQWVLLMCGDNKLLYTSVLRTHSFGPCTQHTESGMLALLSRMEKGGWLVRDRHPSFYHLTEKSILWIEANKKQKSVTDYYYQYFKKTPKQ